MVIKENDMIIASIGTLLGTLIGIILGFILGRISR